MGLDDGESLIAALPCSKAGIVVAGTTKAGKATELELGADELESHSGHRARKGTLIKSGFKPASVRRAARPSAE
jgi:topoisomerase IV subunit A